MKQDEIIHILKLIQEDAQSSRAWTEKLIAKIQEASTSSTEEKDELLAKVLLSRDEAEKDARWSKALYEELKGNYDLLTEKSIVLCKRAEVAEKDSQRYQAECEERSKLLEELRHNYGVLSETNHTLQKRVRELEKDVAYEKGTAATMVDGCMRRDREIEALQEKVEALTNALAELGRQLPPGGFLDWMHSAPMRAFLRILNALDGKGVRQ